MDNNNIYIIFNLFVNFFIDNLHFLYENIIIIYFLFYYYHKTILYIINLYFNSLFIVFLILINLFGLFI
jgi:hypothetical protein